MARGYWQCLRDNPEFRRIYLGRSASLLGTWLNTLAIVHLLGEGQLTDALPLALVFVLKQLPVALLGAAAGVAADRVDRRAIMIACDVLSAVVVCGFLLATPGSGRGLIYALTLVQVCVTTFFDPAYRAVTPDLVRAEDLVAANALGAITWSVVFALGTALGGVVLYAFGWEVAILLDALSYIVSAAFIASVRDTRTRPPARAKPLGISGMLGFTDLRDGLRFIAARRDVRDVLLAKTVWGALVGYGVLYQTLVGSLPTFRLAGSGDLGVSFLWFCRAFGTGIGPMLARRFSGGDPRSLTRSIAVGFAIGVGFYAVLGFVSDPWVAGIVILLAHVGGAMIWVMSTVVLQQLVPSELRGRTFATELGLHMLSASLSQLACAALVDHAGFELSVTLRLAATVCAAGAVLWTWSTLGRRTEPR